MANTTRRNTLLGLGAVAALVASVRGWLSPAPAHAARTHEVSHSDEEWRKLLTREQYRVLRHADTEFPGSSPLNREKHAGSFSCAGCALPLFSSKTKSTAAPAGPASGRRCPARWMRTATTRWA